MPIIKLPGRARTASRTLLLIGLLHAGLSHADVKEVYAKNCASCHGADGKAQSSIAKKLRVRDLTQSTSSDDQIEHQIRNGRPADQKASKMPAFESRLSNEEIKALVTYVKSFRTNSPSASP